MAIVQVNARGGATVRLALCHELTLRYSLFTRIVCIKLQRSTNAYFLYGNFHETRILTREHVKLVTVSFLHLHVNVDHIRQRASHCPTSYQSDKSTISKNCTMHRAHQTVYSMSGPCSLRL